MQDLLIRFRHCSLDKLLAFETCPRLLRGSEMIPSGLKVLLPVMALVTVLATSADTLDQPSSKVMVRGCKAMIVQKQPSDILVAEDKEIGLTEQLCTIQEQADLLDAITAQRKKEGQRQRLKFQGLKKSPESE